MQPLLNKSAPTTTLKISYGLTRLPRYAFALVPTVHHRQSELCCFGPPLYQKLSALPLPSLTPPCLCLTAATFIVLTRVCWYRFVLQPLLFVFTVPYVHKCRIGKLQPADMVVPQLDKGQPAGQSLSGAYVSLLLVLCLQMVFWIT